MSASPLPISASTAPSPPPLNRNSRRVRWLLLLAALAAFAILATTARARAPVFDELEYLNAARNVVVHGVFSTAPTAREAPAPNLAREPGYPIVLAGVMLLDQSLADWPAHCFQQGDAACVPGTRIARAVNSLFIVLAALLVALTAQELGAGRIGMAIAFLVVAANPDASAWRGQILSDYLALFLASAIGYAGTRAITQQSFVAATLAGLALAWFILTRAAFQYLLPLLLPGLLALLALGWRGLGEQRRRARAILCLALFATATLLPIGAWMERNRALSGEAVLTDGRGASQLGTRLLYTELPISSLPIHFLWQIRGFGDNWARALFPLERTRPFNENDQLGFYYSGHRSADTRVAETAAAMGTSRAIAERHMQRVLLAELAARPVMWLVTSIPFAYRGAFIDTYAWISLPALIVLLWRLRRPVARRGAFLVVLSVGVYCIAFHGLLTIGLTRYVLPALPALALAAAFVWPDWGAALQRRLRPLLPARLRAQDG